MYLKTCRVHHLSDYQGEVSGTPREYCSINDRITRLFLPCFHSIKFQSFFFLPCFYAIELQGLLYPIPTPQNYKKMFYLYAIRLFSFFFTLLQCNKKRGFFTLFTRIYIVFQYISTRHQPISTLNIENFFSESHVNFPELIITKTCAKHTRASQCLLHKSIAK